MALSKEALLASVPGMFQDVQFGDGELRLRALSCAEWMRALDASRVEDDEEPSTLEATRRNVGAYVVPALVDDDGAPLFNSDEYDSAVDAIMSRPAADVSRLVRAAIELNSVVDDAVEEEVGNSDEGQS